MKSLLFILFAQLFCLVVLGNGTLFTTLDTLRIEEIEVVHSVVLDHNDVQKHTDIQLIGSIDDLNERMGVVSTVCRGGYAKEPTIQGFSGDQMNVTIDGMRVFGACTDRMDPITSYVEPVNLNHLTVQNGLDAGGMGSNIGGSYDMILKHAKFDQLQWGFGSEYQSISNGKSAQADFNYGKKKWAYRVSGLWKSFESYADGNGETVAFTQFSKLNLYQNLQFKLKHNHILSFKALIDNAQDVGYPALPMDVSNAKAKMFSVDFNFNKQPKNWYELRWKAYTNAVHHVMDDAERDSLFFVMNNGGIDSVYMRMDMPGWSRTSGSFIKGRFKKWKNHKINFKGEYYQHWSKAEMTMMMNNLSFPGEPQMFVETWPENVRNVFGAFLKDEIKINDKWYVAGSYRVDFMTNQILSEQGQNQWQIFNYSNTDRADFLHVIKLQGARHFNQHNRLEFTAGLNQRLPSTTELYGFYLFNALDGYDYLGNPDLKKEQSTSYKLRYVYNQKRFKFTYEFDYHDISNYIFGIANEANEALNLYASGLKTYVNEPDANIFSTNLQVSYKPNKNWSIFNVTKYTRGKIGNENMPLIQPFQNIASLKYIRKNSFVRLEYIYSAPQNRINTSFGEVNTQSYSILNFTARHILDLKKHKIILNAGVQNILNKAYSDHLDWGTYLRPGRNFFIGLSYRLD